MAKNDTFRYDRRGNRRRPFHEDGTYIGGTVRCAPVDVRRFSKRLRAVEKRLSRCERLAAARLDALTPDCDRFQPPATPIWINLEKLFPVMLPPWRLRHVLELRFGLFGNDDHTLEETAKAIGVTREKVRQIEARAMRKLRWWIAKNRGAHGFEYYDL